MKKRIAAACIVLFLVGICMAQTSAPTTRSVAQKPDVPAPKVDKDGEIQKGFADKHAKYVERAKQGDIDLLFMGDSITEGWNSNGKAVWQKYYADKKAANFGISGDRTQHVLWRAMDGELENIHPRVAVLMIGTNNIGGKPNTGDDPAGVAEGIKKIVQLVRDKTGAKVLLLAVFPRGDTEENAHVQREKLRDINRTIAKLDDGKTVRYLDLWDKFTDKDGNITKETMRDYLHPTEAGYQIWAENMDPLLKEMMGG